MNMNEQNEIESESLAARHSDGGHKSPRLLVHDPGQSAAAASGCLW